MPEQRLLPDFCIPGRPLEAPDGIIVHYFSGRHVDPDNKFSMDVCADLFLDLNRAKAEREFYMTSAKWPTGRMYASAHLLVGRGGEAWQLVDYGQQCWHAGKSILNGRRNCNRWTLGVELVGDQYSGFTAQQYAVLADFVHVHLLQGMQRENIAGHDTVRYAAIEAGEATKKKYDPSGAPDGKGDNFDWPFLWSSVDRLEAQDQGKKNPPRGITTAAG